MTNEWEKQFFKTSENLVVWALLENLESEIYSIYLASSNICSNDNLLNEKFIWIDTDTDTFQHKIVEGLVLSSGSDTYACRTLSFNEGNVKQKPWSVNQLFLFVLW